MGQVVLANKVISSSELGPTNSHVHLVAMPPPWLYKIPVSFENDIDYALIDPEKATHELSLYLASGGKACLDATTRDYGRNAKSIKSIIEKIPAAQLILVTGFNRGIYLHPDYFPEYFSSSIDKVADIFANEVEEGIEGTTLRAGAIKIGADYMKILPIEEKLIKAAAQAHKATGAPILVHTTYGTMALEILEILEDEYVDPESVTFFHADRNLDPWYWTDVLERGSYITIDQLGKIKYASEGARVEFLAEIVRRGYEDKILLGTDFARRSDFISYGGGPGIPYLFKTFIPFTKRVFEKMGIEANVVDKFIKDNPSAAFSVKK
ncbi:MAG: hypothetical protein RMI83_00405 [Desulfurococcaceae archaeon]|nr:hypothetical protein [Sulfolobales archaeon]MDW8169560.1 hypothetical protein [Desulfurococcaceae archaeon]